MRPEILPKQNGEYHLEKHPERKLQSDWKRFTRFCPCGLWGNQELLRLYQSSKLCKHPAKLPSRKAEPELRTHCWGPHPKWEGWEHRTKERGSSEAPKRGGPQKVWWRLLALFFSMPQENCWNLCREDSWPRIFSPFSCTGAQERTMVGQTQDDTVTMRKMNQQAMEADPPGREKYHLTLGTQQRPWKKALHQK